MLPVPARLITRWFRRESAKAYRRTRETVAVVIVHFVETINGMRAVQAFRREPRNQEIFDDVNDDYRLANERAFRLVGLFMPGIKLIGNITIAIVLVYGAHLAIDGEVTVGVLAAFLLYLRQFFEPMQEISQFYNTFQSASAALEKLSGVLEEEPSVPAADRAGPAATTRAVRCTSTTSGSRTSTVGRCSPTSTSRSRRADARPGRHHRRRQDDAGQAGVAVLRPDRRHGSRSTASTCATSPRTTCARPS